MAGLPPSSYALHCGDSFKASPGAPASQPSRRDRPLQRDVVGALAMNWTAVMVDKDVDKAQG